MCVGARDETTTARSIRLRVEGLGPVVAGQHVDVRLTADDGYQAVRSYSLSAVPGGPPLVSPLADDEVELTVEELPDGEVSPYLVGGLEPGDPLEIRGPIGGWFVWHDTQPEPVQLIAGGSGVAPLMAMLRARSAGAGTAPFRLLYSLRDPEAEYYRAELAERERSGSFSVARVWTRRAPEGVTTTIGRLDAERLASLVFPPSAGASFYVCGPNGFVAAVSEALVGLGHDPATIRTERFGGV